MLRFSYLRNYGDFDSDGRYFEFATCYRTKDKYHFYIAPDGCHCMSKIDIDFLQFKQLIKLKLC